MYSAAAAVLSSDVADGTGPAAGLFLGQGLQPLLAPV